MRQSLPSDARNTAGAGTASPLLRGRAGLILAAFGASAVLLAGWMVWQVAGGPEPERAATLAPGQMREDEYVIFLRDDVAPGQRDALLHSHPGVKFVQTGKLPGVVVVRIRGDVRAAVSALKVEPAVVQVQKAVPGMVCH